MRHGYIVAIIHISKRLDKKMCGGSILRQMTFGNGEGGCAPLCGVRYALHRRVVCGLTSEKRPLLEERAYEQSLEHATRAFGNQEFDGDLSLTGDGGWNLQLNRCHDPNRFTGEG